MKKILAMLAIALMAISCNNAGQDNIGKGTFPATKNAAQTKNFKGVGFDLNANADGTAIGKVSRALLTKAVEENWEAYIGTYTVDANGNYTFSNLGTITKDGNTYKFIPEGGSASDAIIVDAQAVKAAEDAVIFNRNWNVESVKFSIKGVNKTFSGLNLNEIETFAKENGITFSKTFKANMVSTKVAISDSYIGIVFANGEYYCAEYELPNSSDASFKIDEISELEVEVLNGNARYDILGGKLILTVSGKVNGEDSTVTVTLAPAK